MIRRILVSVLFDPELPVKKDSKLDINLLRAAHQALMNQQKGVIDSFLFIICGNSTYEDQAKAIASYGFPDVQIISIEPDKDNSSDSWNEDIGDDIGSQLSTWLHNNHPAAIADLSAGGYSSLDWWWAGVECTGHDQRWENEFAETLPATQKIKSGTWLAILTESLEIDEPYYDSLEENRFALYCATLCEWLHGFEAASGNSYNYFDADFVISKLNIDNFYLGYHQGENNSSDLEDIIGECDGDFSMLPAYAVKQATKSERSCVRDALSDFFESDVALFWALYSTIWPKFSQPYVEACNNIVNPNFMDDLAELSEAWMFVCDGWTDSADD